MDENENGQGDISEVAEGLAAQQSFEGGHGSLDNLKRPQAIMTMGNRDHASVLQRSMDAIKTMDDIWEELKTANWESIEECNEWCNAWNEAGRYGAEKEWLVTRLIGHNAGEGAARLRLILDTISHTTFTTNSNMTKKKGFWDFMKGGQGNGRKTGPLSQ